MVVTYPGVYIQEFEPAAPITGVGTSTAAFLGPAVAGPVMEPTKIQSWKAFLTEYSDENGMPLLGGYYLWYAVRGFFENGGHVCYVVRVSNAGFDEFVFTDRATNGPTPPAADRDTIVVRARSAGPQTPAISAQVTNDNVLQGIANTRLYRPSTTVIGSGPAGAGATHAAGTDFLAVSDSDAAHRFMRGDNITWTNSTEPGPVIVDHVEDNRIYVQSTLAGGPYNAGTLTLADLVQNRSRVFRLEAGGAKLGAGSVVTLTQTGLAAPEVGIVQSVQAERMGSVTTHRITLRNPVGQTIAMSRVTNVASPVFGMTVTRQGTATTAPYSQGYPDLSMDPLHPRYFATVVAADPDRIVDVEQPAQPSTSPPPFNQPRAATQNLAGGAPESLVGLGAADYQRALDMLQTVDDVNFIAIPDNQTAAVQAALLTHCELMQDRVAIFDSRAGLPMSGTTSVVTQRNALDSPRGYGALYYPWLIVPDAAGRGTISVPPSGHAAGIYARTDEERGVHKAPAGTEATVRGALGVVQTMSDIEQGQLNILGVDVIRVFRPGGRPVVWGARTTATDPVWQYVPIRRLFLFLEESIAKGINWAVFEPNNIQLWQGLKRTIGDFLTRAWRDGALFGETADKAFYVRIDDVLNPYSEQALGRLNIEIGARPAYPAEFIVVRIGIWDGGSEINEP